MSHSHSHENTVPRPALIAAGVLVVVCLLMTAAVRVGWMDREAVPAVARAENNVSPVQTRQLKFADREDGAVVITDVTTREQVALIESDTPSSGFIRGVLRGLARERRMYDIGSEPPFTLVLWQDGSLSLTDTATERSLELGGFGSDNRAAFMALLNQEA